LSLRGTQAHNSLVLAAAAELGACPFHVRSREIHLHRGLRFRRQHPSMEFAVGASIGLAEYDGQESLEAWIARADRAMYMASTMAARGSR